MGSAWRFGERPLQMWLGMRAPGGLGVNRWSVRPGVGGYCLITGRSPRLDRTGLDRSITPNFQHFHLVVIFHLASSLQSCSYCYTTSPACLPAERSVLGDTARALPIFARHQQLIQLWSSAILSPAPASCA
jgi:hypothetical protein